MTAKLSSPYLRALQQLRARVDAKIRLELQRLREEASPAPDTRPPIRHQNRTPRG